MFPRSDHIGTCLLDSLKKIKIKNKKPMVARHVEIHINGRIANQSLHIARFFPRPYENDQKM